MSYLGLRTLSTDIMSSRFERREVLGGRNRLAQLERNFYEELNVPLKSVLSLDEDPRLQMW